MPELENSNQILQLVNLEIGFKGKSILNNITVSAGVHELVALIGANGTGKSTLLRTIAALMKKRGGELLINEVEIEKYKPVALAKQISFVSTENVGAEQMKVKEIVMLGRFPFTNWLGKLSKEDELVISEAMRDAGIIHLQNKNIFELSDGERQRVMIARALAQSTPLILLDEPTAFLDIPNKFELFRMLRKQTSESEKTIIFSTHDIELALEFSDKIWIIEEKNLSEITPENLIMDGKINTIFKQNNLKFNPEHWNFSYDESYQTEVFLEGDKALFLLTKNALKRNGIGITENKNTHLIVFIEQNKNQIHWVLKKENIKFVFNSLPELIQTLKKETL